MEGRRRKLKCVFCGHGDSVQHICGQLHISERKHIAAHHKCMQYSAGLSQYKFLKFGGFKIHRVIREQKRGKKLRCCLSKICQAKSQTGATAGCAWAACKRSFHFLCAQSLKKITSRRSRRYASERRGQVMYLVFCSEEHKKNFLDLERRKGYKNETDNESEDEEWDSTSVDEDNSSEGEHNLSSKRRSLKKSTRRSKEQSEKHRSGYKSPTADASDKYLRKKHARSLLSSKSLHNGRYVTQKTDTSSETSPALLPSQLGKNIRTTELDSEHQTSGSNSDPQSSTTHGFLMQPENRRGVRYSREGNCTSESTCSLQGRKRKLETQIENEAGTKKRKGEAMCKVKTSTPVRSETIGKVQEGISLEKTTADKQRQPKPAVKNGLSCTVEEDSDISIVAGSSKDKTCYLSLCSARSKQAHLTKLAKEDNGGAGAKESASTTSEMESAATGWDAQYGDVSDEQHERSQSFLSLPSMEDLFDSDSDDSQDSQTPHNSRDSPGSVAVKLERLSPSREGQMETSEYESLQEEDRGTSGISSEDDDESLLILPTYAREFEAKAPQMYQHIADKWEADVTRVYNWSKLAPVPVGEKMMLGFIACATRAASCYNWDMMRLLLFDAETIRNSCKEIQDSKLVQALDIPGNSDFKKSQVSLLIRRIIEHKNMIVEDKGQVLVDFSTLNGVHFTVLKINNITDPDHLIRDVLKISRLHLLSKRDLLLVTRPVTSGQDPLEEFSILKNWFTARMQRIHKVIYFPVDEILCSAETENLDAAFKSFVCEVEKLVTPEAGDDSLPVVASVRNINKSILNFEKYLEALGENLVCSYRPRPVIVIFPVSNLSSHLSNLRPPIYCWSTFDPVFKPITYIVASLGENWLL